MLSHFHKGRDALKAGENCSQSMLIIVYPQELHESSSELEVVALSTGNDG